MCVMLFAACTNAQLDNSVSLSELIRVPNKYDGKHVTVRGFAVIEPESRNIFESEPQTQDASVACIGIDGAEKKFFPFRRKYSTVSGIFTASLCKKDQLCPYWCSNSGIILDSSSKP